MSTPERAPVQGDYWLPRGTKGREPGTIAWTEHLEAFVPYAKRYGDGQSAERIAVRGGFGWSELLLYLGREPTTWQPLSP